MELDYNIFLELAVIPLDIMLYGFLSIRCRNRTRVNDAFRHFALVVMLANIIDVATAIITSAHDGVSNPVHYAFNIADSMFAALAGFSFIYYVYAYVKMDRAHYRLRNIINCSLLAIDYILLLTNPLTHLVFYYDEKGNYIHQALFTPVAYGFPILFFVIGSIYMLRHWKDYKKSQILTLILAIIITGVLFILQMLFFDNFLITFYVASMGVVVIYLAQVTPDYEKLIETLEELQETKNREASALVKARLSQEIILALSKTVDAKDHYTNGHSGRVANYAREIARRMGKSEQEQEDIYYMGLLHDVGKIGVAGYILNKQGKLTDEEFDVIKAHTVIGYDILHTITEMPGLSTGARWHHERYNGTGYPDGLSGTDIPEEARIICVADSYDAMTSKRPYSSAKTQQEVRAEIERCKETQFDPAIADIMIEMIDEDEGFLMRQISTE